MSLLNSPGSVTKPPPLPKQRTKIPWSTAAKPPRASVPPRASRPTSLPRTSNDSRRGFFRTSSGWLISLTVHLAVLLVLALIVVPAFMPGTRSTLIIDVVSSNEHALEQFEPTDLDNHFDPLIGQAQAIYAEASEIRFDTESLAAIVPETFNPLEHSENPSGESESGLPNLLEVPIDILMTDVSDGLPGDARVVVNGYQEAMSRLTLEIQKKLERSDVLMIWCFDQSESMVDDQIEIHARIDRIYAELGLDNHRTSSRLTSSVVSFGSGYIRHTNRPTRNMNEIREAIVSVPTDPSGLEFMTDAVSRAIAQHLDYVERTHRQMILVVVTDESGDVQSNYHRLEQTIAVAKAAACPVYILGREAVFGYPYAFMHWRHPQTNRVHWLQVDRGPETPYIEQLQIDGFCRRIDAFGSGFGPYEQSRLARETGGIFFMLPGTDANIVRGDTRRYDLEQMTEYQPDLSPRAEAVFERDNSPLRALLWKVISDLNPYDPQIAEVVELRIKFSADPKVFLRQVRAEQRRAMIYLPYLEAAQKALEESRDLRDQEPSRRWQANYDLMLAQLLTFRVRVYEYNAYLAFFVQDPKAVPLRIEPNLRLGFWQINTRKDVLTGDLTAEYRQQAEELLRNVIYEHPGTPWAARAEWELDRGFGVELIEHYWLILPSGGGGGGGAPLAPIPNL